MRFLSKLLQIIWYIVVIIITSMTISIPACFIANLILFSYGVSKDESVIVYLMIEMIAIMILIAVVPYGEAIGIFVNKNTESNDSKEKVGESYE